MRRIYSTCDEHAYCTMSVLENGKQVRHHWAPKGGDPKTLPDEALSARLGQRLTDLEYSMDDLERRMKALEE
jgi:hypothetical protein